MKRVTMAALLAVAVMGTGLVGSALLVGQVGGPVTDRAPATVEAIKGNEAITRGKVEAVTVYRGQALVTRVVAVPGPAGLSEVVVTDLPEHVLPGSLFAESADGVEVRSIRYRMRPVGQDVRAEVRKVDEEIRKTQDALAAVEKQIEVLAGQRQYLEKLEGFTAPTASTELSKGVLNAEQLQKLTQFQFTQREEIAGKELALAQRQRDLSESLGLQERQRAEITGGSARALREAVVFVNQAKAGGQVRVRYLVDQATWAPSYNIRTDADRKQAVVEYQASIQQMSGEDWTDVQMTLSTATPSLVANAPALTPLTITLAARPEAPMPGVSYKGVKQELEQQRTQMEIQRNSSVNNTYSGQSQVAGGMFNITNSPDITINVNPNRDNDLALNKLADNLQVLELVARDTKVDDDVRPWKSQEGIVVTYPLRGRTSLPSRADRQLIQVSSMPMQASFYKLAIPVLTNYVYDEAQMVNTSDKVLLAGPVSSYIGGQFVGSGEIPTVAAGQPFTVGFGIDSSLRATRERVDKVETIQGGNKVISYTFRLAVENFGSAPAQVRLMDRLPTAKDSEVKVMLADPGTELSKDKEYLEFQRKKGILRWDASVPAQKNGTEAFALTYKMTMEYDKNLTISGQQMMQLQELEKNLKK